MVIEAVVPDDWSLWFRINCGCGNCGTLVRWVTMTAKVFSLPLDGVYEDSVVKDGKEGIFVAIRIVKANGKHWLWGLLIIAFYPPSGGCCWGGGYHFWSASGENIVGIPTEACPFLERNFGLKNTLDVDGKERKNHHRHLWGKKGFLKSIAYEYTFEAERDRWAIEWCSCWCSIKDFLLTQREKYYQQRAGPHTKDFHQSDLLKGLITLQYFSYKAHFLQRLTLTVS